jgi:hypothetical protein
MIDQRLERRVGRKNPRENLHRADLDVTAQIGQRINDDVSGEGQSNHAQDGRHRLKSSQSFFHKISFGES